MSLPMDFCRTFISVGIKMGAIKMLVLRREDFFFSDPSDFLPLCLYHWSWLNKTGRAN